mmetsp:Transcript_55008/g.131106  ORF Transcript_55008/g.131106 Transcript_55008/m.131106 type:complete len:611 (-) Transcript_55008:46-1878(-)
MALTLPPHSQTPAGYCQATAALQAAIGEEVRVPGPAVLWLTPSAHLLQESASKQGPESERLPPPQVWWAGDGWRHLPTSDNPEEGSAYIPERISPQQLETGLLKAVPAPLEPGPEHGEARPYSSGHTDVVCVLQVLLCMRGTELWARRRYGAGTSWQRCPFSVKGQLDETQAFEIQHGDRYLFLFNSGAAGGVSQVLAYDAVKNLWEYPVSPTRPLLHGHAGAPPVQWRPVKKQSAADAALTSCHVPMQAWLLEASADYLLFLAPVCRDGRQSSDMVEDAHAAVHFIGNSGEVVSHHLTCAALDLTVQRYDDYFLFAKDCNHRSHADNSDRVFDNDFCQEDDVHTIGWLLSSADVALPPLPVMLPAAKDGFELPGSDWCLVLARGCQSEDPASHRTLWHDSGHRLVLLQLEHHRQTSADDDEAPYFRLRLWTSRRADDDFNSIHHEHSLDGSHFVREALTLYPLPDSEIEVDATEDDMNSRPVPWSIWSPDLHHIARVSSRESMQLGYWRCGVLYEGNFVPAASTSRQASTHAVKTLRAVSASTSHALPHGWGACVAPAQHANGGVILSGMPIFPVLRWGEASFDRPEDRWLHPVGRDASQPAPHAVTFP